jgi:predicted phage terminase large subunit-like protein
MSLPSDLKSRLTPSYVSSLTADKRRKLAGLLSERHSLEVQGRARESLIAFTEYTFPKYRTAPFHQTIAGQLERVERGEIDRLMLLLPPRHGKSELASKRYPAWLLGRNPTRQFISVSATAELASDFGRDVRNIIGSQEYRTLFDTRLAEDSQAKGKWHTSAGGIYYAIGIGGSVLGRGADVLLVDDPFRSMEDALSEITRKNVWDWYTGTAYNRLMPNGAIVVINHRMHEDDLSGRLLAQQAAGGDKWEVVELPAISETNEALWPEAYPIDALHRTRKNTPARFFSALYQQQPAPEEGDYFKAEWLRPYDKAPSRETLRIYGASDMAVTANGGDFTVHIVVGVDPDWRIYVLDLWRAQTSSADWVESLCNLVARWKPVGWAEEQGQIRAGIGPFLERRMRERQTYVNRKQFPTRGDKAVRAQSIRGRMELDGLYVPTQAHWYPAFLSELLNFPAGKHDDQVDALGLIGQILDRMAKGTAPSHADQEIRFMNKMTMDEVWSLAQPKRPDLDRRI